MERKPFILTMGLCLLAGLAAAGHETSSLSYTENKGQWPDAVLFRSPVPGGEVYLENNGFSYVYYNEGDLEKAHDLGPEGSHIRIHCHALKVHLENANQLPLSEGRQPRSWMTNYFQGNDPSRWAAGAKSFERIAYTGIYPGVNMEVYSALGRMKYDFILQPGADARQIVLAYDGALNLELSGGNLLIRTSVNEVTEQRPYAYQMVAGEQREVPCRFILEGNRVLFAPGNYDKTLPLVIDPVVLASTYSGSTATTYGHCATFDSQGNIFTGGRCFGAGYPVTAGAFDLSFGGSVDIAISKLNPTGTAILYATYLGGNNNEYAHSMFVNGNDELCVYGSSESSDYPVTPGCFDNSQNGNYDIIVTHLNSSGSALIGSTFVGGSQNDGQNILTINYGDTYRGEIVVDSLDNIYVASFSSSANFPLTAGSSGLMGAQDAAVFKLDPTCSNLMYSTLLGGTANDAGYGIKVDGTGGVYVSGGTVSPDFPVNPGCFQPSFQGGAADAFITHIDLTANTLLASTFYGTSARDAAFFIETDASGIYILGQTAGTLTPTAGVYGNAGAKNFIARFNDALTVLDFQTVIGSSSGAAIAPTAFLVDNCGNIYLSGFGSAPNYPLTANALYTTQSIGQFYLAVLNRNADSLLFATYYGGNHVDGGTSRFDKNGIVYQGVCQGGPGFPTLPGSVGPTSQASWDICVFKIDMQTAGVQANASVLPSNTGCMPYIANFINQSSGKYYYWDFGDGWTDTVRDPIHTYSDTGFFTVTLIAYDTGSCNYSDTMQLVMHVLPALVPNPPLDTIICGLPSITLAPHFTDPNLTYRWPDNSTASTLSVINAGSYWVDVSNGTCSAREFFLVQELFAPELGPDTNLCSGQSVTLFPNTNATSYAWSTGDTTPSITVRQPGHYVVSVSKSDCVLQDSLDIQVFSYPVVDLGKDTVFCPGTTPAMTLQAGTAPTTFLWSTGDTSSSVYTQAEGTYWVEARNAHCLTTDTIVLTLATPVVTAQPDTFFCDYSHAVLDAGAENVRYLWSTGETTRSIHVIRPGEYWYTVSYASCVESDTLNVMGTFGEELLWFPSAFTPNGDGKNDIYLPIGTDINAYDLRIFNRWGKLIFRTNDLLQGWNGTENGHQVQMDVYVYRVDYTTSCTDEKVSRTGYFLLSQ